MSNRVLVIGGGCAGLTAALACTAAGRPVTLVERAPVVGGKLAAALLQDGEVPPELPSLEALRAVCEASEAEAALELLTLAELERLSGDAGAFQARIRQRARFVTDACTRCNHCPAVCPRVTANEFDAGLTVRKAIHTPLPETLPAPFVIDIETCLNQPPNYLPCQRCVAVCDDRAIDFSQPLESVQERRVSAVILATGLEAGSGEALQEFGYGRYPDVVTAMELQRMLQAPGPSGGFAVRPSDEGYPERVLLVLPEMEVGALQLLSAQLAALAEQGVARLDLLLLLGVDTAGLEPLRSSASRLGASLCHAAWAGIRASETGELRVTHIDLSSGRSAEQAYDLVVLADPPRPSPGLAELAAALELPLTERGYLQVLAAEPDAGDGTATPRETAPKADQANPAEPAVLTARAGIYAVGGVSGPKPLAAALGEARAGARLALRHGDGAQPTEPAALAATRLYAAQLQPGVERLLESLIALGKGGSDP